MIKIKEAIIVEGKYDKIKLSSIFDALIIETNGFRIFKDKKKLALIRELANKQVIRYFDTYRDYHYYTRNCNTFAYEMAKSIGLSIANKHKTISPVGAAKNILKSRSAKEESSEEYFAEFDNTKSYWEEESNGGKRKPLKENNGKFSLPLTANEFSEEAKKAAKKDHRIRHRKADFVIESMRAEFSTVEDKIRVLSNHNNKDEVIKHCKFAEQKYKQRAFSLEKGWTNLELYFMQISNLFYQVRMMLNNNER